MTNAEKLSAALLLALFITLPAYAGAGGSPAAPSGVATWQGLMPPAGSAPFPIQADFLLLDLEKINDEEETFEFSGILTLTWKDSRQVFDPAIVSAPETMLHGEFQFNELAPSWYPQVILSNAADVQDVQGVLQRGYPDGTVKLVQTVNATARSALALRRYPFDRQELEIVFEVLGFDDTEIALKPGSTALNDNMMRTPQWDLLDIGATTGSLSAPYAAASGRSSTFVITLDVQRQPFFVMRLVVLPLAVIMVLSWSVFWMDRSSLGDRMAVSFVGILTSVAYQSTVSEIMPQISYMTLIHGFLYLSFLLMCSTVVINLVVGTRDRRGDFVSGDLIDRRCRWLFPLLSVVLFTALAVVIFA